MEIKRFSDIDNEVYRSQVQRVYAVTNDKNLVPGTTEDNCLNEMFVFLKDGSVDYFIADSDIDVRTQETEDFNSFITNWCDQTGVNWQDSRYFKQLRLGSKNKEEQKLIRNLESNYQDYEEGYEEGNTKKPLSLGKKAAIAAGTVATAGALAAGGFALHNALANGNQLQTQLIHPLQERDLYTRFSDDNLFSHTGNNKRRVRRGFLISRKDNGNKYQDQNYYYTSNNHFSLSSLINFSCLSIL